MEYVMANSIPHALAELGRHAGNAKIIAGGTDLLLDIEAEKCRPNYLVDITGVQDLLRIAVDGDDLVIGGAVTHAMASGSALVQSCAPALAEACRHVGSTQIQNVATIAGNIVSAQPAADTAVALAALGCKCTIASREGTSCLPLADLYAGFGKSTMDSCRQLLTEIRVPLQQPGEASAYVRLELRRALALPILNVGAMAHIESGLVRWARISMAPVGVGPVRALEAEQWLNGKALTKETAQQAGEKALAEANPRSNPLRGSKEYRMQTLPVLVARALMQIADKLAGNKEVRA